MERRYPSLQKNEAKWSQTWQRLTTQYVSDCREVVGVSFVGFHQVSTVLFVHTSI